MNAAVAALHPILGLYHGQRRSSPALQSLSALTCKRTITAPMRTTARGQDSEVPDDAKNVGCWRYRGSKSAKSRHSDCTADIPRRKTRSATRWFESPVCRCSGLKNVGSRCTVLSGAVCRGVTKGGWLRSTCHAWWAAAFFPASGPPLVGGGRCFPSVPSRGSGRFRARRRRGS